MLPDTTRLTALIRAKVTAGTVQKAYDSQPVFHGGGGVTTNLCQGCDLVLESEITIGYRSDSSGLHWFHFACDEIRRAVSELN